VKFVYQIREKTERKIMLCGYCYNNCPVGKKCFIQCIKDHVEKWGLVYVALFQYAKEKGCIPLGCPIEIYLNDVAEVKESELLTEVQLPIKKNE